MCQIRVSKIWLILFDRPFALVNNTPMSVIDFHTHIFPPELCEAREECQRRDGWFSLLYANARARMASADDLVTSMTQAGITSSVAFGFAFSDMALCRMCNDYVLDVSEAQSPRIVPFAVVNPHAGRDALREARRCLEAGAAGIGELMPDGQEFSLTDFSLLDPIMALARSFQVPVMLHVNEPVGHVYPGKGSQGPREAFEAAAHYPDNLLILPHWGGGLPFYELMPEVCETLRNVYYDTSASPFLYESSVFRHVTMWASQKVLFGTDYPLISQRRFLRHVQRADLASDVSDKVLFGNARGLLQMRVDQQ